MNVLLTVQPFLAVVCLSNNDVSIDSESYFNLVLEKREQTLKNLRFIQISEEARREIDFIITVFTDEMLSLRFKNWKILQLQYFNTNMGGELFFEKLTNTFERYNKHKLSSEPIEEELLLLELYGVLLSLGFKGKYWSDINILHKIAKQINDILYVSDKLVLTNEVLGNPKAKRLSYLNMTSIILMLVMLFTLIGCLLIIDDFVSIERESWQQIKEHVINGVH